MAARTGSSQAPTVAPDAAFDPCPLDHTMLAEMSSPKRAQLPVHTMFDVLRTDSEEQVEDHAVLDSLSRSW